ncbi:MAG: nucleotidyltransferase domain-containing protein [Erysipelotrichaceae bacterium]|nr:nucleotidyltransferase domain-containing protein [Erysipelotrichaceae bacterium]
MLKDIRNKLGITQKEASIITGIPLRTYINYELDEKKQNSIKYKYILETLKELTKVDEEHGILSLNVIIDKCKNVFMEYPVDFCYLFGSYAKGNATEISDIDLLISTNISGMKFFGLVENLRLSLNKKIDLLTIDQIVDNKELLNEILKDGIKIYG